jgi:surfeit locus 1 family protein
MTAPVSRYRRQGFWWITLAALVAMGVTAALGTWQLGRASQKTALQAQRAEREGLRPVGWEALHAAPGPVALEALHDRVVHLRGAWVPEATVFLENRTMQGRPGFFVVTPLRPVEPGPAVLIQRGWVPRRFDDRSALPTIETPVGLVEIEGRLAPPPSKFYTFEGEETGAIRQNIDLDAFAAEWSLPLLQASVQQSAPADAADGLLRDWPRVGYDVHKHYGYAFQWFGLCALIACLYVWFQFIAPRRRHAP